MKDLAKPYLQKGLVPGKNSILPLEVNMTLQQTVRITQDRQVHLDLPVPEGIPIGEAEIRVIFISSKNTQLTEEENTKSLFGMFADTGDTLDKFLTRKRTEKQNVFS